IRPLRCEQPLDEVRGLGSRRPRNRRPATPATYHACKAYAAHETLDRTTGYANAFTVQLPPNLPRAVDFMVGKPDAADLLLQPLVPLRTLRSARRIGRPGLVRVVRRRSDRQLLADRLDSVFIPVLVDERHHHFARRSSSACAKYAD